MHGASGEKRVLWLLDPEKEVRRCSGEPDQHKSVATGTMPEEKPLPFLRKLLEAK